MPCGVCSHDQNEKFISFKSLNVLKPKEHTQNYHNNKTDDETFLFQNEE